MKRTIAIIMLLVILLTTAILPVYAAEPASEKAEIIDLACQAFPEYTDIICGRVPASRARSNTNEKPEMVFSETRSISDDQSISITYYSDGGALLTRSTIVCDMSENIANSSKYTYWTVTGEFTTTYTDYPGVFTISNAEFRISTDGTHTVTDDGNISTSGCSSSGNYSSTTEVKYGVRFMNDNYPTNASYIKTATVGFKVQNGSVVPTARETT